MRKIRQDKRDMIGGRGIVSKLFFSFFFVFFLCLFLYAVIPGAAYNLGLAGALSPPSSLPSNPMAASPPPPTPTDPLTGPLTTERTIVSLTSWQDLGGTFPVTLTISNVFWDTPPKSGSVAIFNDEQVVLPGPEDEVRVIIQLKDEPVAVYKSHLLATAPRLTSAERTRIRAYADELRGSQQRVISEIKQQGIELKVRRGYNYIFNGLAASIRMKDMEQIRGFPGVKGAYPDHEVHALLDESVPLIGADQVWAMGVTGEGTEVAILDTGIDYTHPDLGGCFGAGCKVMAGYDFVNDDADPMDDNGHGTHVAGIVAANGAVKGVAPDATLYAYKVCDENGGCWNSDIIAAIERATDPDGDPATDDAVDVISMSLGGGGDPDDPMALAVDAAVDEGVVVTVAAGNSGSGYQTVSSPGVARKAFTVGATDKSDNIAGFSSRGPVSGFYELIKPDIVAPGVSISSTVPISGELGSPDRYLSLNGTSMATPHIAGAAALIKQLHPDWTSEMIKANLMNTAKDLDLDIYTQGAGRVQVNEAAVAQAVVVPGSVGFGVVDVEQPLWVKIKELRLTNPTASSVSYSLQVTGDLPTGVTTDISPANVTLGAGASVTVSFAITVDNALVPYPSEAPYVYEGEVLAQSGTKTLVVPFAFIKSPMLSITFDEEPWTVLIHNRDDKSWFYGWPGTSLSVLLPEGTYDVNVHYPNTPDASYCVVREGVVVSTTTNLNISKSEAIYQVDIVPIDKDGHTLNVNHGGESFIHQSSGLGVLMGGFRRHKFFSGVSSDYSWEWTCSAYPANDEFYVLNGQSDGISSSMTFENTPADFNHLTYQYHVDPGIEEIYVFPWKWYVEYLWASGHSVYDEHAVLGYPFIQNAYLMPAPTSDFHWYNRRDIYEYTTGPDFDPWDAALLFTSPFLQAVTTSQVEGYLWGSSIPIFSSSSGHMRIGLSPPRWSARLRNVESEIRVDAIMGHLNYFYLTQMGDFTPNTGLSYELYQEETPITSGTFESAGSDGFGPFYESIEVTPGAYTLKVPYPWYYVGDQQGNALMTATFDTRNPDKDPPFLTSLNILSNGEVTDVVPPSGTSEVKFNVEDDTSLGDVSLFYRTDGSWIPLSLTHGTEHTAQIPELPNGSYVSLKIVAEDSAGNSLTYEMLPAFMILVKPPVPIFPPDGWATGDTEIAFTWNSVPEAASYRIQIDTVDTFDSPSLTDAMVTSTEYTATFGLDTWYWHVLAIDGEGNESLYSPTWHFTVARPVVQVTTDTGDDHDPSIVQAADGTLWVVWHSYYRSGNDDIWYKTSTDGGATWSTGMQLTTYINNDCCPAIAQAADGTLWVVWSSYRSGNYDIWYKTSSDGGVTWSAATQSTTDINSDWGPAIAQAADGTLWVVWYSYRSDNTDIWYKTSTNGGATWSAATQLTTDTDSDDYPAIAQAADGTIWAIWQRNGRLWYRTSSDGGATWSAEAQVDGNCCYYGPSLMVDGDGVMWLASERNNDIWYQTSSDNGATWSTPQQWSRFVGYDHYPSLAGLNGNRAGLVWQSNRSGNDDVWFGIFGEREDVNPPPHVGDAYHVPDPNPDSDDTVTVRAYAQDETVLSDVHLVWELNEVSQADALMYDDGAHDDYGANDDWYGVQLGPFAVDDSVSYTARATDNDGNTYTYPWTRSFQVLEPFTKTADILFVPDYGGNDTDWFQPYFTNALDDLGYTYDVWDTELRGAPNSDMLAQYVDGVIIWAAPYWGYIIYSDTFTAVQSYLDSGGRLFLTSQDTGYYLNNWGNTAFLNGYLHAMWVQDDTELYALNGTAGDPIGDGLTLDISGGDEANNQNDTDEIDPISPAVTVLTYDTAAVTALAEPVKPEAAQPEREGSEPGAILIPVPWGESQEPPKKPAEAEPAVGLQGIASSGTGGLRVDTGTYKVVFFSFGFEGINSRGDRAAVMERVLAWLREVLPRPTQISPADGSAMPVGDVTFTWHSVAEASGYQIQIDTTTAFTSPALISDTVASTSYTATLSLGTWYWRVRALPDGEYASAWQVRAAGPVIQVTTDTGYDYDPVIVQATDGTLYVVWYSGRSGNYDIWYKTSTDGGSTWSAAAQLTTNTNSDYAPAITQAADGTLWVVWYSYRSWNYDIWYKTSTDNGTTWSAATQLTTDTDSDYRPAIAQAADGTLWVVWYSYRSGNRDIWYKTSSDGGATWSAATQLTTDTSSDYYPTVAQAADGTIWVVWVRNGRLWYRTSSDGGASWSAEAQIDGNCCYYRPSLMVDGGVMWLGSERNDDIWYQTSNDGGATWSAARQWTRFAGYDDYPSLAALSSNRVGLVWQSRRSGNDDIWFGIFGEREDVSPPPYVLSIEHTPPLNPDSDDVVTFRAYAQDETSLASVHLVWELNEVSQADAPMYDDGAHGDDEANDDWYGVQLGPFAVDDSVSYTVQATDDDGNTYTYPGTYSFQVLEPFTKTADILFVPDYGSNSTDWFRPYFTNALDSLGYSYDVWDTGLRGKVYGNILNLYTSGVVIWASPYWGYFQYSDVRPDIEAYLDAGGKLFITGQNVAQNLNGTTLLSDYLHAGYVQDDTDLYALNGTIGDPIGDGLVLGISGGDGANNQGDTDEIDPISPAVTVFTYDTGAVTALAEPVKPEATGPEQESGEPGAISAPVPWDEPQEPPEKAAEAEPMANLLGIISSGTAGLRVDTGTYKVVYFAFGFEGINSAADRQLVMERVLDWVWPLFGDLDFNCVVNVADIMKVADRWRMVDTDPDWNPRYDLNNDGIITVVDIMLVVKHWGETCP